MTVPGEQLYKLVLQATGEVRDSAGNLISSEPIEATATVTAAEAAAILAGDSPLPESSS